MGCCTAAGHTAVASLPPDSLPILVFELSGLEFAVDFSYGYEFGFVHYSSIPMDAFLTGGTPIFADVYGPNVVAHAVSRVKPSADQDDDGIPDAEDHSTEVPNADQRDTNADGYGNLCDADINNDGAVDFLDLGLLKAVFFTDDADADLNGDGGVDFLDLGLMKSGFFQAPGPSGLSCAGTIPCP